MNIKKIITIAAIALVLSLALAAVSVQRSFLRRGNQKLLDADADPRHQAAKSIYRETPFYYPFKAAPTKMVALTAFTQDFANLDRQNSQGFRGPEYTLAHPPNTFRIVIIGDDATSGFRVPFEETFPAMLGRLLDAKCNQIHFEVIPLGVPGQRLADDFILLLAHAQSLKPDLVVFQVSSQSADFYPYADIFFAQGVQDVFADYEKKEAEVINENSIDWQIFSESLERIATWSKTAAVPVAFVAVPVVDSTESGHNFNHYDANQLSSNPQFAAYQKIVGKIQSEGLRLEDLLDNFKTQAGARYLTFSESPSDLNAYAHRLIAQNLVPFLEKAGLVGCKKKVRPAGGQWTQEYMIRQKAARQWALLTSSYEEQFRFFTELNQMYPSDAWITTQMADVYSSWGRRPKAAALYSALTDVAPSISAPWYHMAMNVSPNRKREYLERMIKIVPDHAPAMQTLSDIYVKDNRVEDACNLLQRLTTLTTIKWQFQKNKQVFQSIHCAQISASTTAH